MARRPRRFRWWLWGAWGLTAGITAALWYPILRPDPTFPRLERLETSRLDMSSLPEGSVEDPFSGEGLVHGHLEDPDGRLLAGIAVRLNMGMVLRGTYSDSNGRFRFENLPLGVGEIVTGGRGYEIIIRDDVPVIPDAPPRRLVLEPVRNPVEDLAEVTASSGLYGSVTGRCAVAGSASCYFRIRLEPLDATGGGTRAEVETDPRGRGFFEMPRILPGEYRLSVLSPTEAGESDLVFAEREKIRIESGQDLTLDIEAPQAFFAGTVSATQDSEGADEELVPVPQARIWYFWKDALGSDYLVCKRVTLRDGTFQLTPVPPGSVRVRITATGYQPIEESFVLDSGTRLEQRFVLQPTP